MRTVQYRFTAKRASVQKKGRSLPEGSFYIPYQLEKDRRARRKNTGQWFKITSEHGETFRVLRFGVNLSTIDSVEILLDWDAWLALSNYDEETPESLTLSITKAGFISKLRCGMHHPDAGYRLAFNLGVISLLLGLLSLLIALLVA